MIIYFYLCFLLLSICIYLQSKHNYTTITIMLSYSNNFSTTNIKTLKEKCTLQVVPNFKYAQEPSFSSNFNISVFGNIYCQKENIYEVHVLKFCSLVVKNTELLMMELLFFLRKPK